LVLPLALVLDYFLRSEPLLGSARLRLSALRLMLLLDRRRARVPPLPLASRPMRLLVLQAV
jgi:hypothetical protein